MTSGLEDNKDPCSQKLAYQDEREAIAARVYAEWRYGNDTKLVAYKCRACVAWHLASRL